MRALLAAASAIGLLAAPAFAATAPTPHAGARGGPAGTGPSATSPGPANQPSMASQSDQTFVNQASEGNAAEIEAGQLARRNSRSLSVQEFGLWMQTDHRMANQLLKAPAKSVNAVVQTKPDPVQQRHIHELQKLSGVPFDEKYIEIEMIAHEQAITLFQDEAKSTQNPELKAYAKSMLPALEAHLSEVEALRSASNLKKLSAIADQGFVDQAAGGNAAEVEQGELAMRKSRTPAVQEFGRWMRSDHTMANALLMQAVKSSSLQVPATPNPAQISTAQRLQRLDGAAFDRQYIDGQVIDHQNTVALFKDEAESGSDQPLKAYAQAMLPALQAHLQEAEDLQALLSRNRPLAGASGTTAANAAIGASPHPAPGKAQPR